MSSAEKEAPAAGAAWGSRTTEATESAGCDLSAAKRLATAQARAALRGIALHVLEDDRGAALYVASLHAMTRQFDDLAAVETWLNGLDAAAA